ncbi:hypothetical protein [Psychroserpens luteus]|uniref:Uncharacterized protein n=1 Tax=Psychroserpens luteus TaxID=1434066 RepID=A0ABW5ZUB3_9FLAO|nr:hypothetical protein [Psychroserpens luteus]
MTQEEINHIEILDNDTLNKKIILIPLDLNKKGNFKDSYYLREELMNLGFGSKGLNSLSNEDQELLKNNKSILFSIEANGFTNNDEIQDHYKKYWLIDKLYNSSDAVLILNYFQNNFQSTNSNLRLKINLEAHNILKTASKNSLTLLSNKLYQELNKKTDFNYSKTKIFKTIKKEVNKQSKKLNNRSSFLTKVFSKNNVTEVYYQNICNDLNIVLHVYQNKNTTYFEYTTLEKVKERTGLSLNEQPFVVFKKNNKWIKSELKIDFSYNDGICSKNETVSIEEQEHFKTRIKEFIDFSYLSKTQKDYYQIEKSVKKILENEFYKDVKLKVVTWIEPQDNEYSPNRYIDDRYNTKGVSLFQSKSLQNFQTSQHADILIDIKISKGGKISISNKVNPKYLKQYEAKWVKEAKLRGLEVNIPELRRRVHRDIENLAKAADELSFYTKFIQNTKALFHDNIASYVEGIAATQKIAKNVWDVGIINEDTWHTNGEFAEQHKKWPEYCQFHPVIGGIEDGVIDEIVGIPMAIKGVYELVVDEEKQEAFKNIFTKDGLGNLYEGLKQEVKDTYNDSEKREHFGGKTTVSVVSMMSGAGLFSTIKKLDDVVDVTSDLEKVIPDAKTTKFLDDFRKADRHVDTDKALKEITEEVGGENLSDAVDELTDLAENATNKGKKYSWKEVKAFFKRGNDFNAKSKDLRWYDNNEIWMTHPTKKYPKGHKFEGKPRRYRLDSWDINGDGKIVSRKATDLDKIKTRTFENYCREIGEKYLPGSKIANPDIGDKLFGKYYLEIPDVNLNFSKLDEYIKIAEKYKVIIIFKPE